MSKKEEKKVNAQKESELVTKESFSAVCALFSLLALFILFTRSLVFGTLGGVVHAFLIGAFGYTSYPLFLATLYLSVTSLIGKRFIRNRKATACIALSLIFASLIVHTALTYSWDADGYLKNCFYAGENFPAATVGGFVGGLVVLAVFSCASKVGALIAFSVFTVFFAYLASLFLGARTATKKSEKAPALKTVDEPVEIPLSQSFAQSGQGTNGAVLEMATASNEANQTAEARGFIENARDGVEQRPTVRLSDDEGVQETAATQNVQPSSAFSPFGTPQSMREIEERERDYQNSRAFLFGATPAENYQKNLIFDPNANVNKRPPVDPSSPNMIQNGYTPSYSAAYENSVNESTQQERPVKIFSDRSNENIYSLKTEENLQPLHPIATEPLIKQEPVSYPTLEEKTEPIFREQEEEDEQENEYSNEYSRSREEEELDTSERTSFLENERGTEGKRHDYMDLFSPSNPNVFGNDERGRNFAEETFSRESTPRENVEDFSLRGEESENFLSRDRGFEEEESPRRNGLEIFDEEEEEKEDMYTLRSDYGAPITERSTERFEESSREISLDRFHRRIPESEERIIEEKPAAPAAPAPTPPAPPKPRVIRPYVKVPLDDFDCRDVEPTSNMAEVEETKANIIATLDDFKVTGASIASVTFGPTVTRYNVTIPRNISPRKVVALDQSIAISLHSSGVNIYPNYEDGVVSIEVPNKDRQFVQLGCMLTGDTFVNAKSSSIMFTMGKDVGNRKVYGDISKMIHLLVAGSSGSGKSVFLGSLIISLIYKYSPEELRLILIDPKKTEFVLYNDLPHLMINEIITDVPKAVQSLNWAIGEMNRRYGLFEQMSRAGTYVVNLDQYNSHLDKSERLPKIVIIIDELADLMLAAKKEIEDRIQNLTQKARAAGIHLIVATQRPSTDVITGVIKSNLPTRIAFAVASDVDSRVILDQTGAQKLLGKGDFLYTMQGINTPVRVQSAFISSDDSQRVVNFIKQNNEAYYDESATAFINNTRGESGGDSYGGNEEVEPVYIDALRYVIISGSASISMIQRKCSVGYNKAGKIVEWMEDMGYISAFDGAKARRVLITPEEFESKYGPLK